MAELTADLDPIYARTPTECDEGQVLTRVDDAWICQVAVPSGAVMYFPGDCPAGWDRYVAAMGRTVVGTPLEGTDEGTVGEPWEDLGRNLLTDVPAHAHTVDPPAQGSTLAGRHTHETFFYNDDFNGVGGFGLGLVRDAHATSANRRRLRTTSEGDHFHVIDIPAFASSTAGIESIDITTPYVQLTPCQAP